MPIIGDAIEALHELCVDLADALKQIADLSAELALKDHVRIDNIREVHSLISLLNSSFTHQNVFSDGQCARRRFFARTQHGSKKVLSLPRTRAY